MRFTLTIDSNDQHATEFPQDLVTSSLQDIAVKVGDYYQSGDIRDANGVRVGSWEMVTD